MAIEIEIPAIRDDGSIPDDATCQEASTSSHGFYIPCGARAMAIVRHDKDRRAYYMCPSCADHNVKNRGGKLVATRELAPGSPATTQPQQALVILEPKNRAEIDANRLALIADAERELPDEIVSPSEYSAVGTLEARLGAYIDRVEPVFDAHVSAAHKVWKTACAIRALFIDGPKALKAKARELRGAYELKEAEARRAEERRLAEEERQRQLARQREEAKLLERQGQKAMADAVRQQPVHAPSVSLPTAVPAVEGVTSLRTNWTWRIAGCTDRDGGRKNKAARKQAARLVPREYLDLDDAALTSLRTMQGTVKVPGIEFYEEKV